MNLGSGVHVGDDIMGSDEVVHAQQLREDQHTQVKPHGCMGAWALGAWAHRLHGCMGVECSGACASGSSLHRFTLPPTALTQHQHNTELAAAQRLETLLEPAGALHLPLAGSNGQVWFQHVAGGSTQRVT